MKALLASLLLLLFPAQQPIHVVSESAVVWGTDRAWAHSSTPQDPLTGRMLRRINTDDAEVTAYVSFSQSRSAWEAYSIFVVATITVANVGDHPLEVSGSTQTLEAPAKKYFEKQQIMCPYFADWTSPRKKNTEPVPAEVKGSIPAHASQQFSIVMHIHADGMGVPDNVPTASRGIGDPVDARYSIRINGVNFVFPTAIPTEYVGDYKCRPEAIHSQK